MQYIEKNNFLDKYNKSKELGYINDELNEIFDNLIFNIYKIYLIELDLRKIFIFNSKQNIINNWDNYKPELNSDPFPYYNSLLKRHISILLKKDNKQLKEEFYYETVIKFRKDKIDKIKMRINLEK